MAAMWAAGAAVVGDVVSGIGQSSTNRTNEQIAQQEMAWQTQMSDTQMQRRVTDLKAAGLNPMLAVGGPGAAMGSPVMPNVQNPMASAGQLGNQVSSAMQLGQQSAQISLLQQQARNAQADADAKQGGVDAPATTNAAYLLKAQADSYKSAAGLNDDQAQNVRSLTQNVIATLPKIEAEAQTAATTASYAPAMAELQKNYAAIGNILAQASEPAAQAQAQFFKSLGALGTEGSSSMMKLGLTALMTLFGPRMGGGVLYNK